MRVWADLFFKLGQRRVAVLAVAFCALLVVQPRGCVRQGLGSFVCLARRLRRRRVLPLLPLPLLLFRQLAPPNKIKQNDEKTKKKKAEK